MNKIFYHGVGGCLILRWWVIKFILGLLIEKVVGGGGSWVVFSPLAHKYQQIAKVVI
jgi:hypothetical protein